MPDENAAPGSGTSGTTEAPGQPSGQGFDFERAYGEIRPAYTQATQRLSEYESLIAGLHDPDPEVQAQAAQLLGLEFAEETGAPPTTTPAVEEEEWEDPLEKRVEELSGIVSELRERGELEANQKADEETLDLRDEYIGESITAIEEQLSQGGKPFKFSDQEEEVLGNLAISMADDDDIPDVQGAYEALLGDSGIFETRFQQRIESKRGAAQAPLGTSIPADKKPRNAEERIAYMDERWRAMQDQQ